MPPPRTIPVDSFNAFTKAIQDNQSPDGTPMWFRGVGETNFELIPSLYRHPSKNNISDLIDIEKQLLTKFKHRSIPFQQRPIDNAWEMLFLMQHYGVPTRLLDWSENPYIALYFALTTAKFDRQSNSYTKDAAVWILNTKLLNQKTTSPYWGGQVLGIQDNPLEGFAPGLELGKLGEGPIAIAGYHNSPRIVAQRGAFTIFGHLNKPLEKIFEEKAFTQDTIIKIEINKDAIGSIRENLFSIGYADSMVYPDLSGLATELKRQSGFEVR